MGVRRELGVPLDMSFRITESDGTDHLVFGYNGSAWIGATDPSKGIYIDGSGDKVVIQPGTIKQNSNDFNQNDINYSSSYGILGETENGVQAEYVSLPEYNLSKMSDDLTFEESASMQLVFMTSYQMLVERAKIKKDDIILIYGGTSGIGMAAIQIAKDIGAIVISTVGSSEKIKYAQDLGSDHVFLHDDKLLNNLKQLFGKVGISVVFEHVGLKTWNDSLKILSRGGRIVTCGSTTGAIVNVDLRHLFMKQQSILGSTMGSLDTFRKVMSKIENKIYKPCIDKVYIFDDII